MRSLSRRTWLAACAALLLGATLFGAGCRPKPAVPPEGDRFSGAVPRRIVSVVPSVTETLFALGLGERVVGVSDFCRYPPEVRDLPKLGGLYNPNIERIIELGPDLAVLLREHRELNEKLVKAGIPTLTVDHASVTGILDSFEEIARRCDAGGAGTELRRRCEERLAKIRSVREGEPVSVLMVLDRDLGQRKITQVYAAGKNRYFNDLIRLAGGRNVLADVASAVPTLSREGILEADPDVIVDLSSLGGVEPEKAGEVEERLRRDWDSLADGLAAVREERIYPILADYATIPGPRFIEFAELLSGILHPCPSPESGRTDEN